jgi:hypothetical protein
LDSELEKGKNWKWLDQYYIALVGQSSNTIATKIAKIWRFSPKPMSQIKQKNSKIKPCPNKVFA